RASRAASASATGSTERAPTRRAARARRPSARCTRSRARGRVASYVGIDVEPLVGRRGSRGNERRVRPRLTEQLVAEEDSEERPTSRRVVVLGMTGANAGQAGRARVLGHLGSNRGPLTRRHAPQYGRE